MYFHGFPLISNGFSMVFLMVVLRVFIHVKWSKKDLPGGGQKPTGGNPLDNVCFKSCSPISGGSKETLKKTQKMTEQ